LVLESERTRALDRRPIAIDPIEVRRGLQRKCLCAAQKKCRNSLKLLLYNRAMSSSEKNSKPEPDRTYEPKERKCLKCREEFLSAWPGERICRTCKSSSAWREGIAA
jgi:hypothetical protein